jgi:hypothetical protein
MFVLLAHEMLELADMGLHATPCGLAVPRAIKRYPCADRCGARNCFARCARRAAPAG